MSKRRQAGNWRNLCYKMLLGRIRREHLHELRVQAVRLHEDRSRRIGMQGLMIKILFPAFRNMVINCELSLPKSPNFHASRHFSLNDFTVWRWRSSPNLDNFLFLFQSESEAAPIASVNDAVTCPWYGVQFSDAILGVSCIVWRHGRSCSSDVSSCKKVWPRLPGQLED